MTAKEVLEYILKYNSPSLVGCPPYNKTTDRCTANYTCSKCWKLFLSGGYRKVRKP